MQSFLTIGGNFMIYHDILGINILADTTQIENAYSKCIDSLKINKYDTECPALYYRKVKELSDARDRCLAYTQKTFREKTRLETHECFNRAFSSNVTNSCGCGTCCSVIFVITGIITGLGVAFGIKSSIEKSKEEDDWRELQSEYQEGQRRKPKLNNEHAELLSEIKVYKNNLKAINENLNELEGLFTIVGQFMEENGVKVNLKETRAYSDIIRNKMEIQEKEKIKQKKLEEKLSECQEIEYIEKEYNKEYNKRRNEIFHY